MTKQERKTTFYIASIYAFRMLGLFMILPVFSLYANNYQYANATLIGIALGIYGLTQGLLQIPFGMSSDRIGRKPVIIFGLILFIIGSVIAALSHSIYGIIIGRAIQGAGAIGSTLTALVADSTEEEHRLKAMSIVGMTIGSSFMIAIILGPFLNSFIGLSGIFWFTACLACCGIIMLLTLIPTPPHHFLHRDSEAVLSQFKKILTTSELLRLDFGIFASHAILTALFVVIPLILVQKIGLHSEQQWMLYLPVLILSFILMMPFVILAEAKRLMKPIFIAAIAILTFSQFLLGFLPLSKISISIILVLFFTAFTFLEACLPSLIAKIAPAGSKGTAMGVYSSSQFLGILAGGTAGGILFHHFGMSSVFLFNCALGIIWFIFAVTMQKPPFLSSKVIHIASTKPEESEALKAKLLALPGVKDAMICPDEQAAYLKIDKREFSQEALSGLNL